MAAHDRQPEHAELFIDDEPVEITSVRGTERVCRPFGYAITGSMSSAPTAPADLLGRHASLELRDGHGGRRTIAGMLDEPDLHHRDDGISELHALLRPLAWPLTLGGDCRVFHDATVGEIAEHVLERAGVDARFELTRSYRPRVYTAQYRESDWAFLCRLFEAEGIYTWFDHQADSILVISDGSQVAPDLPGGPAIAFAVERGMHAPHEIIEELGDTVQATPSRFVIHSFDADRPNLEVRGASGDGSLEVYDAPGAGPTTPEASTEQAELMRQAAIARRARVRGKAMSSRITPGRRLVVDGHPIDRFCRGFFVTAVDIEVRQRRRDQAAKDESPWTCRFEALRDDVPYRPEERTEPAQRPGLQAGFVVGPPGEEVYPDEAGRVRVQLAWDREGERDDRAGKWMRVVQRGTAESLLLPRVGWTVMTANEEGSADAPLVLSRTFDAEHPPPYSLPDNKTRTTYKTATTPGGGSFNELHFEDRAGAEKMHINASRDMSVLARNDKTEAVTAHTTRHIGHDQKLDVGDNEGESVGGSQTVSIGIDEAEKVGQNRTLRIGGDETGSIGATRKLEVAGVHETSVSGTRTLKVGAVQIDASLGNIASSSQLGSVLVGGTRLRLADKPIVEDVGTTVTAADAANAAAAEVDGEAGQYAGMVAGAASSKLSEYSTPAGGVIQAVGAAKVELATEGRTIGCDEAYAETVGGNARLEAASITEEVGGSYTLDAQDLLVYANGDCTLEASEKIELVSDASKLTITTKGVELSGPTIQLDGDVLTAKAGMVDLNEG